MRKKIPEIIVVGAGFFGAVLAERIAGQAGLPVRLFERRSHIGGNSWSEPDPETGIEFHKYGSHIFHTSDQKVWDYIRRFTDFNEYRHTVWTTSRGRVFPLPINLAAINGFYGQNFSPSAAREFIMKEAGGEKITHPANLEEKAVSLIGRPLYEAFIRGYTIKQWEKDPRELSADIITRLPVRYNYNIRYFSDKYEGVPLDGYGALFKRLLKNELITLSLGLDFLKQSIPTETLVIYSGAIDEFFDYRLGRLDWRTLHFEAERHDLPDYQGTSVMNYADPETPFTRIHEFKHYHPERPPTGKTLIFREFSRSAKPGEEPYYPVPAADNPRRYQNYLELAKEKAPNVIFGGRLGAYKYLDMDDSIAEALKCYEERVLPRLKAG